MAVLAAIGTAISAVGTLAAGVATKRAKQFEAEQYRTEAQQAFAAGQRDAAEEQKQKNTLISAQIARGAASSFGGATDTSVLETIGNTEQEGTLRELSAIYAGQERARGLRNKAKAATAEGRNAQAAGFIGAAGTLASGIGSIGMQSDTFQTWAQKYG